MSETTIITMGDFYAFVQSLVKGPATSYKKSLGEYLRSLWSLIEEQHDQSPSFALFGQLLSEAFTREPPPFEDSWLAYEKPPLGLGRKDPSTLEDLREMILYQIADLHRMQQAGILNKPASILWGGISLPGGHTWYNFHPQTYLECASAGLNKGYDGTDCDWGFLAIFLWLGQIYE